MDSKRDRRHVGAASAAVSAGAVVFFTVGAGPASAESGTTVRTAGECHLSPQLCGVLNRGKGSPSSPPTSGGGGGSSAPKPQPKPKPRVAPKPSSGHSSHSGSGSAGGSGGSGGSGAVGGPIPPPPAMGTAGNVPTVPAPQQEGPALPDIVSQDPIVYPQAAPAGQDQSAPARLMAASGPEGDTTPPLLIATASGLVGAVTALNLSVLGRRRRRSR